TRYLGHAARFLPAAQMDALAGIVRDKFKGELDLQLTLFKSVQDGVAQRGGTVGEGVRAWGEDLARRALTPPGAKAAQWIYSPVRGMKETASPWGVQKRKYANGKTTDSFLSSLPSGETLTGVLRSPTFAIPEKLEFFLAGHDGHPTKPPQK